MAMSQKAGMKYHLTFQLSVCDDGKSAEARAHLAMIPLE
jgi:hypothetical protein